MSDIEHSPQPLSTDIVLTVQDLRIVLDPSGIDIDDDVSFSVHQGEVLGLVGESASGKTTAATSLLAHQRRGAKIAGGSVTVNGTDILTAGPGALRRIRGGLISYVPQDASAALNPALRIGTQLIEILEAHNFGSSGAEREARRAEMLAEVLLPSDRDFLRRYPHQLSGGQQQRVAIAMAFACRPKVIVLDEPTTALDVTTQSHVLETIRELTRAYGVSALYVTHDLAVVANLADRIAVMYAGRLVEIGAKEALFAGAWHPYTRKLLAAIPDLSGERALRGIPGWAPRPGQRVAGCAFTPRCDMRIARCATEYPPYEGKTPDHQVRCWRWKELVDRPLEVGGPLREIAASGDHAATAERGQRARHHRLLPEEGSPARRDRGTPRASLSGSGRRVGQRQDHAGALHRRSPPLPHRRGHRTARHAAAARSTRAQPRRAPGDPVHLPEPLQLVEPAQDDPPAPRPAYRRLLRPRSR